jgi:hypothetical protein
MNVQKTCNTTPCARRLTGAAVEVLDLLTENYGTRLLHAERARFLERFNALWNTKGQAAANAYALLVADALDPTITRSPDNSPLWIEGGG